VLAEMMSKRGVDAPAEGGWVWARERLARLADVLIAVAAVSLPWSTQATSILIVLWLIALLPALDATAVRRELMSAAGSLPVLVWVLGAVGMLWADVSWSERVEGLSGFNKLLMIPLLLAQFRHSGNGFWALAGFLASSAVLLLVSWSLALLPGLAWRGKTLVGVPVKDYLMQSAIFGVCAFGLIGKAAELWRMKRVHALMLLAWAALFLANIVYVATARTTLVVIAVLLALFGLRQFGWKGALAAGLVGGVLAGAVWASAPNLRERVSLQVLGQESGDPITPVGLRLEYWKRSLGFIAEAPVVGYGTGSIPMLFQRVAAPDSSPMLLTENPHNQILTVAIELGLIGACALVAMWIAHLALFAAATPTAWFGLTVVAQNIAGSLFNSHLFDFGHGWLYVIGVGVIGGMVLHAPPAAARGGSDP
jgi:O-antigen ligase